MTTLNMKEKKRLAAINTVFRGRPCKGKIMEETVKRIVELARGKYKDFNDHHLSEKLGSEEKIKLSREKLRQLLRSHGIAIFPCITVDFASRRLTLCPPGEKSVPFRSNRLSVLRIGARWLKTTPLPLRARSFRFPRNLPSALTLTGESMCTCFWTAPSSFSTKMKKLPPSTPKQ